MEESCFVRGGEAVTLVEGAVAGRGIERNILTNETTASTAGLLIGVKESKNSDTLTYKVANRSPLYFPKEEDHVVGRVVNRTGMFYSLDIGHSFNGNLSNLAFQGATKHNKPTIAVGALVYCRVLSANKFKNIELTCIHPEDRKGYTSGESFFGELVGGYLIKCSLDYADYLRSGNPFLKQLGDIVAFEVAVGVNGSVWIKAGTIRNTIILMNLIKKGEHNSKEQVKKVENKPKL
eukprot:CAMPEP_0114979256 /NCGR_PEP_ID=MMETSP0216-20121206/4265_1 /TAXON_ID=223996 /ORGANISM="Protocruzia adherens, Strain Boccale" /LENGTH=234 /DNA_ID=CAMNT_0002340551 /DNA_START=9 /DNA_END=713 /DNA_ORIENTATION=+